MPVKVEPLGRGMRGVVGRAEGVRVVVVRIGVEVEGWIPQGTAVGLIVQKPEGEDVGLKTWGGVHSMGACRGVDDRLIEREIR